MRKRLYRYGPRDFLNLITNYTLRETLECPIIDLEMNAILLKEPHDLVAVTLAITKEERNLMFCRDMVGFEEEANPQNEYGEENDLEAQATGSVNKLAFGFHQESDPQEHPDDENFNTNRCSSSSSSSSVDDSNTKRTSSPDPEVGRPKSPKFPGELRYKLTKQLGGTAKKKLRAVKRHKTSRPRRTAKICDSIADDQVSKEISGESPQAMETSNHNLSDAQGQETPPEHGSTTSLPERTSTDMKSAELPEESVSTTSSSSLKSYEASLKQSQTSLPPITGTNNMQAKLKKRVQFSSECKDADERGGSKRGFLPAIFSSRSIVSTPALHQDGKNFGDLRLLFCTFDFVETLIDFLKQLIGDGSLHPFK